MRGTAAEAEMKLRMHERRLEQASAHAAASSIRECSKTEALLGEARQEMSSEAEAARSALQAAESLKEELHTSKAVQSHILRGAANRAAAERADGPGR